MSQILEWLSGGDLRSDGMANETAEFVLNNPEMFEELLEGLTIPNDIIRGRTADAIEKVARTKPELVIEHIPAIIQISKTDTVPMVKMHLAMLFGHLAVFDEKVEELIPALFHLLDDTSVFARSWAITSLCIIGRKYTKESDRIVNRIAPLYKDKSIAVRSKVQKAVNLLTNEGLPFPKGWIKSEHLRSLER